MSSIIREAQVAVLKGDFEKIDALIAGGLNVNARSESDDWNLLHTALISVTTQPDPGIVSRLIQLGVQVNARDRNQWTPLHFAVRAKSREAVRLLLAAGAEVDPVNDEGITPLHLSTVKRYRDFEIAKMLLDAGADPDNDRGAGTVRGYITAAASPDIATFRQLLEKYPKR